jgi:Ig-like domain from next to BRCA1 gene
VIASLFVLILAGCNTRGDEATTPTLDVTQAYQTVEARLTEAIAQTPRTTPTDPPRPTATITPTTAAPTQPVVTTSPAVTQPPDALCDQALPGVPIDVTIPDDTQLSPGEEFTKTWRLQNAGTCTWSTEYALAWFSGEQLDAPLAVPLIEQVLPGQTVDLSVDMTAPETAGTYQSNWKLRNPTGAMFGIGPSGGSAFWVRIVVTQSGTPIGSPSPTAIAPTSTSTPGAQVSGSATLQIGDQYDLDTNLVNSGGEDLTYMEEHVLSPVGDAALTLFGGAAPSLAECQSLDLFSDPLPVDDLVGTYLCYRTNMALPGRLLVSGIDADTGALQVEIFTWAIP